MGPSTPPVDEDSDALWRPGGPAAQEIRPRAESDAAAPDGTPPRRTRLLIGIAVIVAVVAFAAIALGLGALRPPEQGEPPTELPADSMPSAVVPLWSASGPEFISAADFAGDSELVVAVLDDGQPGARASLRVFDGGSGAVAWTAPVALQPSQVDIVATTNDVVVVSTRRAVGAERLVAFDTVDGSTRWERSTPTGSSFTTIDAAGVLAEHDQLGVPGRTTLVDMRDGDTIDDFTGRIERLDRGGTIEFVDRKDDFVVIRVDSGVSEQSVVANGVQVGDHAAAVDENTALIARNDGTVELVDHRSGASRRLTAAAPSPRRVVMVEPDRALVVTPRSIVGILVSDDRFAVEWTRPSITEAISVTAERTVVLTREVDDESVRLFSVIDASNGETLTSTPIPDTGADPIVAADGVVVRDSNHLGGAISGFEFDGTLVWTLDEPAVTRFGDDQVLALVTDPMSGHVLTAYGDRP